MQVFDESWQVAEVPVVLDLSTKNAQIQVQVSCTQAVTLQGVRQGQEIPLKVGQEFRVRAKTSAWDQLTLSSKVPFGYRVQVMGLQDGEPLNADNPPAPPLPGADNLVAQFQRLVRANARRDSAPYMDPEDLPFGGRYTIDDDDQDFEEEIAAKRARKAKETPPAPPASKQPEPPATAPTANPTPSVTPSAPEAQPGSPGPTPPAAQAAE